MLDHVMQHLKKYMRNKLKYLIVLMFVFLSTSCSGSSTFYYFCMMGEEISFYNMSFSRARMFFIQTNAQGRRLIQDPYFDDYFGDILAGSYDEGSQIITTYKRELESGSYTIWRFDFLNNELYDDKAMRWTPKQFQEWTGFSPTPENIKKYNVKPELLKYVPDKKTDPSFFFTAHTARSYNCQSMGYLQYRLRRVLFILHHVLTSMG